MERSRPAPAPRGHSPARQLLQRSRGHAHVQAARRPHPAAQRPDIEGRLEPAAAGPARHARHHRNSHPSGRHPALRNSLSPAFRGRPRRCPDRRSGDPEDRRCQPLHDRAAGLCAGGAAGQGAVRDRPGGRPRRQRAVLPSPAGGRRRSLRRPAPRNQGRGAPPRRVHQQRLRRGRRSGRSMQYPRRDRAQGRRRGARQARGHRRIVGRCDRRRGHRRHHHELEPRSGALVRLHGAGSRRPAGDDAHSAGPRRRGDLHSRPNPAGKNRSPLSTPYATARTARRSTFP